MDRRHQLRDLLLQCRDERGELLHAARRTSLDPHGDPLAHPHGDAFERSPRDRADDGGDSCSGALGEGWRRRTRRRGCRRLPERRPQVSDVLGGEVGIGVAHATLSSPMRASARVIGRDRAGVGRSARCASTRDAGGGQPSARATVAATTLRSWMLLDQPPAGVPDRRGCSMVRAERTRHRGRTCPIAVADAHVDAVGARQQPGGRRVGDEGSGERKRLERGRSGRNDRGAQREECALLPPRQAIGHLDGHVDAEPAAPALTHERRDGPVVPYVDRRIGGGNDEDSALAPLGGRGVDGVTPQHEPVAGLAGRFPQTRCPPRRREDRIDGQPGMPSDDVASVEQGAEHGERPRRPAARETRRPAREISSHHRSRQQRFDHRLP